MAAARLADGFALVGDDHIIAAAFEIIHQIGADLLLGPGVINDDKPGRQTICPQHLVELAHLIPEILDLLAVDGHRFAEHLRAGLLALGDDVVLSETRQRRIERAGNVLQVLRAQAAAVVRQIGAAAAHGVEHDGGRGGPAERAVGFGFELIGERGEIDLGGRARQPRQTLVRRERDECLGCCGVVEREGGRTLHGHQKHRERETRETPHGHSRVLQTCLAIAGGRQSSVPPGWRNHLRFQGWHVLSFVCSGIAGRHDKARPKQDPLSRSRRFDAGVNQHLRHGQRGLRGPVVRLLAGAVDALDQQQQAVSEHIGLARAHGGGELAQALAEHLLVRFGDLARGMLARRIFDGGIAETAAAIAAIHRAAGQLTDIGLSLIHI